ncbi:MAG: DUF58 domain-containing protein [Candidatus Methanomethylicia archaeon]
MIRITSRGFGVIVSLVISLTLYLTAFEQTLIYISLIILILISIDLIYSTIIWSGNRCECTCNVERKLWIWEVQPIEIEVKCRGILDVEGLPNWIKDRKIEINGDLAKISGKTVFPHFGEFSINKLTISRKSILNLFIKKESVNINVNYKVLPESLYWVLRALNILREVGGEYGYGLHVKGVGRAYYHSTREYIPGDSLKDVDWKATLRTSKLMVKVFEDEVYGGLNLIYDLRGPSKYVLDEIASALISSTIYAINEGIEISFTNISEMKRFKPINIRESLMYVIREVLESKIFDLKEVYEYIEPLSTRELNEFLTKIGFNRSLECKDKIAYLSNNNLLISTLTYNINEIIDLAEEIRRLNRMLTIITASKPYIGIRNLEEAYRIYLTFNNVASKLRNMNINVIPWRAIRGKYTNVKS